MIKTHTQKVADTLLYVFLFATGILITGLAGYWLANDVIFITPDETGAWLTIFWGRFQVLFILAVLIERSVETYLNATRQNGEEFFDAQAGVIVKARDAKQPAMLAALVLSTLVALSGVRIIETLVTIDVNAGLFKSAIWYGIDILVSAGLMAGGADLFHKVAEIVTSGLVRMRSNIRGELSSGVPPRVDVSTLQPLTIPSTLAETAIASTTKNYKINISRPISVDVEKGTLEFKDGGVSINATCWWDKNNRIDAGTYTHCSKTHMATSGIKAIYLPNAVSKVTGAKEIFIHWVASPENSNGCIAVETGAFTTLWAHIRPPNGQNVTVVITDM